MEGTSQNNKRVREDSDELELNNSPEVKRLREDLLDGLDETDLESLMRSFEEEITTTASPPEATRLGESGESNMPDLGYLLEASDDELGLPPSTTPVSEVASNEEMEMEMEMERNEFGDLWRFDDQIPSYDSFEFGMCGGEEEEEEFVALDGLFDYSDFGGGTTAATAAETVKCDFV